jgi:hypothetical protein
MENPNDFLDEDEKSESKPASMLQIIDKKPKVVKLQDNSGDIFTDYGLINLERVAEHFHRSGALPSCYKNPAQIVMALQAGREVGLMPIQSINSFYLVNGNIRLWGSSVPGLLRRAGWQIKWQVSTVVRAEVVLISPKGEETLPEAFTIDDANTAGLTGKLGDVYKKFPRNMLRWRALGNAIRFNCPEVLMGHYMVEEVSDFEEVETKSIASREDVLETEQQITEDTLTKILDELRRVGFSVSQVEKHFKLRNLAEIKEITGKQILAWIEPRPTKIVIEPKKDVPLITKEKIEEPKADNATAGKEDVGVTSSVG